MCLLDPGITITRKRSEHESGGGFTAARAVEHRVNSPHHGRAGGYMTLANLTGTLPALVDRRRVITLSTTFKPLKLTKPRA